ncbi:hypothetical protein [Frankia sp. AgW1.1]|uniref:hypothetical protein n=1 Tax=Frankia sp. AgW1.1 TaxID=1836971 RepID=UPI001A39A217|nr:hypothetical protein [Frankia sp. AgW1.1]MBL7491860.1 hypothetical protein [Frankia sp. AgW1.1]MBL7623246.1 hypothetical protein [Frankia sp. AgB1.8]
MNGIPDGVARGDCAGVVRGASGTVTYGAVAGAVVLAGTGYGVVTGVEDGVLAGAEDGPVRRSPPYGSRLAGAGVPVDRAGSDVAALAAEKAIVEGDVADVIGGGSGLSAAASVGR